MLCILLASLPSPTEEAWLEELQCSLCWNRRLLQFREGLVDNLQEDGHFFDRATPSQGYHIIACGNKKKSEWSLLKGLFSLFYWFHLSFYDEFEINKIIKKVFSSTSDGTASQEQTGEALMFCF